MKWYKWLVYSVNPPARRCGLKIPRPAYSHLATVEECDSTAGEVLVVTVFVYLVGSVTSQLLEGRVRHLRKSEFFFNFF